MKYTSSLFLAHSNICHIFSHPTPHSLRHRSSIPSSYFTLPHHNSSSSPLRGTAGCIPRSENGYAHLQLFQTFSSSVFPEIATLFFKVDVYQGSSEKQNQEILCVYTQTYKHKHTEIIHTHIRIIWSERQRQTGIS